IWPGWKEMPKDMPSLESDPAALRKRVQTHFEDILGVTRGKIVEWDVMNEPYAQNDMMRILGWSEMSEWFRMAKRLDPNARLAINDYPLPDSLGGGSAHLNHYAGVIERLIAEKAPVESIGFQGHFGDNVVPPERLLGGLDRFARYGLPIVITEFDINTKDEDLQARYMRDFLTACFSHSAVDMVVIWGFWEGRHWFPDAGLYRRDWSLRPQGQVWLDLVKKRWWTDAAQTSDSRGEARVSGFFGDYEVVVSAPGFKAVRTSVGHTKASPLNRTVVLERG
ncbi:MAG: endo-1,4-beta-xylanase, partial [Nitrospirae bacterium]|nr:endo-1,4-beta-xylanase [Fimbriimonadaceae bacterium]